MAGENFRLKLERKRDACRFTVAMIAVVCLIVFPATASVIDVYPGEDFDFYTVVNSASAGDTLYFHNGTYNITSTATVSGQDGLTLKGEDASKVIFNMSGGSRLGVQSSDVTVDSITFKDAEGTTYIVGLTSSSGSGFSVTNCIFEDIKDSYCIYLRGPALIDGNRFIDCTALRGIYCRASGISFTNNTIEGGEGIGFYLYGDSATDCIFSFNDIDIIGTLLYFRSTTVDDLNMKIFMNNIVNITTYAESNDISSYVIPSQTFWTSPSMEYTYNGATNTSQLGNYWSGYTGTDSDGDGIGDTQYEIPDGLGTDNAPLVAPFENYVDWDDGGGSGGSSELAHITVTPSDVELFSGNNCTFTAVAHDGDLNQLDDIVFEWTSSNEAVGTVNSFGFFTSLSAGTTTIKAANGTINDTAVVTVIETAAELSPVSIKLNETHPVVDVVYNLTVKVRNTGNIAAGPFNVTILQEDIEIANETVPGLDAGKMYYLVIPSWNSSATGNVHFEAVVDSGGVVTEENELNNIITDHYWIYEPIPEGIELFAKNFMVDLNSNVLLHYPENLYRITIANSASQDSGPFNISIWDSYTGATRVIAVDSLPGCSEDNWERSISFNVSVNFTPDTEGTFDAILTIDPENNIAELDETNNQMTETFSIIKNGYAGHRVNGEDDIQTLRVWDINGSVTMSVGNSRYTSMGSRYSTDTNYMNAAWSAADLKIPKDATIVEARLMLPYCWDLSGTFDGVYETITPKHVNMTFNGVDKTYDKFYTDRNGWSGYDVPYGQFAYNVTDEFLREGTNAAVAMVEEGTHQLCPRGMILMVVYEDKSLPRRQIFYAEGFDLLIGEAQYYTTPEMATAYADITGPEIDLANMTSATLIAMATGPDGFGKNDARINELLFNNHTWKNGWGRPLSPTEIAIASVDVTGYVNATYNEAGGRDYADYIEPMNFLLIASYGEPEKETPSYVGPSPTPEDSGRGDNPWSVSRGRLEYKSSPKGEIKTSFEGKALVDFNIPSEDEKFSVKIPKGTVTLERDGTPVENIRIEAIDGDEINGYDTAVFEFAGAAYECSPAGATFSPEIELVFTLTEEEWEQLDGKTPCVMYYNTKTKEWEEISTTYDPETMTVTATVSHFSKYAVFAKIPEVPAGADESDKTAGTTRVGPSAETVNVLKTTEEVSPSPVSTAIFSLFAVLFLGVCCFGVYRFRKNREDIFEKK